MSAAPVTPSLDPPDGARLHFTETWEDPRSDARALRLQPGDRVLAITAGGCTPLSLLTEAPVTLTSLDYNPAQTHLLELKAAALRSFPASQVERLLRSGEESSAIYQRAREDLSPAARAFWDERRALLDRGVARAGAATAVFYRVGQFLRRKFKPKVLEQLFEPGDLERQRGLYDEHFDYPRVRWLASAVGPLFSGPRGRRALFGTDYFPLATERNIPSFLWDRVEHAMTRIPAQDNYFLSRVLLDQDLSSPGGRPPYLEEAGLARLRDNLDRLEPVTAPIEVFLRGLDASSVDAFQLSNVFEWMPEETVGAVCSELVRVARPGARLLLRNLFTDRGPPPELGDRLVLDDDLSNRLLEEDRSFIYARYRALRVVK
ncbi:MAG TPA: DUF3419 family protein [Myxococcaceae bacterium]